MRRLGRSAFLPWSLVVMVLLSIGVAIGAAKTGRQVHSPGPHAEGVTAIVRVTAPDLRGPGGRSLVLPVATDATSMLATGQVAVIVSGLGIDPQVDRAAAGLAPAIGLAWSAYGENPQQDQVAMRRLGHEIWLDLPVSKGDPSRFPVGPLALSPSRSDDRNLQRLRFVLARASPPTGVVAEPGAFAASPARLSPVVAHLVQSGLPLLLYGAMAHGVVASAVGPERSVAVAIGSNLDGRDLDEALTGVASSARRQGKAIAVIDGTVAAMGRIQRWQVRLDRQGLTLVAPSRLLFHRDDRTSSAQAVAFRTRAMPPAPGGSAIGIRADENDGSVEREE